MSWYQERNYKLYGNFDKYHLEAFVFLDDNERKYQTLKTYEDLCQELKDEIKLLKSSYDEKFEKVKQLSEDIEQAETLLRKYHEEEEYYKKLEKDNQKLKQEKGEILSENQRLTSESRHLRSQRDAAQKKIESLQGRSFWQRLFNK